MRRQVRTLASSAMQSAIIHPHIAKVRGTVTPVSIMPTTHWKCARVPTPSHVTLRYAAHPKRPSMRRAEMPANRSPPHLETLSPITSLNPRLRLHGLQPRGEPFGNTLLPTVAFPTERSSRQRPFPLCPKSHPSNWQLRAKPPPVLEEVVGQGCATKDDHGGEPADKARGFRPCKFPYAVYYHPTPQHQRESACTPNMHQLSAGKLKMIALVKLPNLPSDEAQHKRARPDC